MTTPARSAPEGADPAKTGDAPPPAAASEEATPSQEMLRALAHPLRLQLVERLTRRGTARAADLAAEMGVPANSLSYHLRMLARGGVLEEAPEEAQDRRDRVWRLRQSSFLAGSDASEPAEDPGGASGQQDDYAAASAAVSLAALEWVRSAWIAETSQARAADQAGARREGLGTMHSTSLLLTMRQAEELGERADALLREFAALHRDAQGRDLPADPAADAPLVEFRALFALVGGRAPSASPDVRTGSPGGPSAPAP